ncbi:hypothetical protein CYMTET_34023 [Cymbomonas tetramitiformis]|uniref:Uncharacterized protein n=1 Tax=Cymbomonas tetramitiformis TaxID=36881 RepID=A0AAE0FBW0_9CHLO|nr:hypothetical protein CYMTET_34023 [Cymbomonas tetramitiformis]
MDSIRADTKAAVSLGQSSMDGHRGVTRKVVSLGQGSMVGNMAVTGQGFMDWSTAVTGKAVSLGQGSMDGTRAVTGTAGCYGDRGLAGARLSGWYQGCYGDSGFPGVTLFGWLNCRYRDNGLAGATLYEWAVTWTAVSLGQRSVDGNKVVTGQRSMDWNRAVTGTAVSLGHRSVDGNRSITETAVSLAKDRAKNLAMEHWIQFCDKTGLASSVTRMSLREAKVIFCDSQMVVVDEIKNRARIYSITFSDFLEAIARAADLISPPTEEELDTFYENYGECKSGLRTWEYFNRVTVDYAEDKARESAELAAVKTRLLHEKLEPVLELVVNNLLKSWGCANSQKVAS